MTTTRESAPVSQNGRDDGRKTKDEARPAKLSWRETRELEQLEGQISDWESEKAKIQAAINESGSDYTRVQSLAAQLEALTARLEAAMERWAELAERAE